MTFKNVRKKMDIECVGKGIHKEDIQSVTAEGVKAAASKEFTETVKVRMFLSTKNAVPFHQLSLWTLAYKSIKMREPPNC